MGSLEEDDEVQGESAKKNAKKTYSYTYPDDSSPTKVEVHYLGTGVKKTVWEKAKPKLMKEVFNSLYAVPLASTMADLKEIELLSVKERWFIRKALGESNISDTEVYMIEFFMKDLSATSFILVRIENNCKSYSWVGWRMYIDISKILNRLK